MEQAYCTAVFWRGGEKIDLNGRKPDALRCLSVTGERKVNLSFLRDYPNLEELRKLFKNPRAKPDGTKMFCSAFLNDARMCCFFANAIVKY